MKDIKEYVSLLKHTLLFQGVEETAILAMLGCLDAKQRLFSKGSFLYHQGDIVKNIAILLDGKLHIQKDDYWGNCNIINTIGVGEMFGEAYISPTGGAFMNNVVAVEDSVVLFLNSTRILTVCSSNCQFHSMVIQNLVFAISEKNRKLVQKLGYISNRSTREKLMSYLSEESKRQGSPTFTIPFNRQQLADYLSVDRSAMSAELSKMKSDGLLTYERSKFKLIDRELS